MIPQIFDWGCLFNEETGIFLATPACIVCDSECVARADSRTEVGLCAGGERCDVSRSAGCVATAVCCSVS